MKLNVMQLLKFYFQISGIKNRITLCIFSVMSFFTNLAEVKTLSEHKPGHTFKMHTKIITKNKCKKLRIQHFKIKHQICARICMQKRCLVSFASTNTKTVFKLCWELWGFLRRNLGEYTKGKIPYAKLHSLGNCFYTTFLSSSVYNNLNWLNFHIRIFDNISHT